MTEVEMPILLSWRPHGSLPVKSVWSAYYSGVDFFPIRPRWVKPKPVEYFSP
jgi:hypothetical protein